MNLRPAFGLRRYCAAHVSAPFSMDEAMNGTVLPRWHFCLIFKVHLSPHTLLTHPFFHTVSPLLFFTTYSPEAWHRKGEEQQETRPSVPPPIATLSSGSFFQPPYTEGCTTFCPIYTRWLFYTVFYNAFLIAAPNAGAAFPSTADTVFPVHVFCCPLHPGMPLATRYTISIELHPQVFPQGPRLGPLFPHIGPRCAVLTHVIAVGGLGTGCRGLILPGCPLRPAI